MADEARAPTTAAAGKANGPSRSNARVMFRRLRVAEPSTRPYSRDLFKHWIDENSDGCDTRREVLRRENVGKKGGACSAETGTWVSVYDGLVTRDPSSFDVDHLIPLAEAWRSGADSWPPPKRQAFANDLHPFSLIAVSASSNRSKSDQDPATWLPPETAFVCQYVARWIAVKFRWRLTVDPAEKGALARTLKRCDNPALKLTLTAPKVAPDP